MTSASAEGSDDLPGTRAAVAAAVLVPVAACAVTLALLTAYVTSGAAGTPPAEITVTRARLVQPLPDRDTVAYIDLRNTGGTDATLVSADAPLLGSPTMLARDVETDGAGRMEAVSALKVPAGGELRMSPEVGDVMVEDPPELKLGERVEFVLRFGDGSTAVAVAVVVRAGE
jgi:copper(I)-binding protein